MEDGAQDLNGVIFGLSKVVEAVGNVSQKEKSLVDNLPEGWRGEASREYKKILTELYNLDSLHSLLLQLKDELQRVNETKSMELKL